MKLKPKTLRNLGLTGMLAGAIAITTLHYIGPIPFPTAPKELTDHNRLDRFLRTQVSFEDLGYDTNDVYRTLARDSVNTRDNLAERIGTEEKPGTDSLLVASIDRYNADSEAHASSTMPLILTYVAGMIGVLAGAYHFLTGRRRIRHEREK